MMIIGALANNIPTAKYFLNYIVCMCLLLQLLHASIQNHFQINVTYIHYDMRNSCAVLNEIKHDCAYVPNM